MKIYEILNPNTDPQDLADLMRSHRAVALDRLCDRIEYITNFGKTPKDYLNREIVQELAKEIRIAYDNALTEFPSNSKLLMRITNLVNYFDN